VSSEREQVIETCTKMAVYADQRRWEELTGIFARQVHVDYTSLNGGDPEQVPAADLVAGWQSVLGALDATQHLVANHLVIIDGDQATVTASFQATHLLDNPYGDRLWALGGDYRFTLARQQGNWRITAITMTATWAAGNQQIMTLAAAKSRA
jgi:hypothetical protein